MRNKTAMLSLLLAGCGPALGLRNVPVVEVQKGSIVAEEQEEEPILAKPQEKSIEEKVQYVTDILAEIQKAEPLFYDGPGQVRRYTPNSEDSFQAVYYPDLTCYITPRSLFATQEEVLEFEYSFWKDDQHKITIKLRDFKPFNSIEQITLGTYDGHDHKTWFFNTKGSVDLYKELLQILYEEFSAYQQSGNSWQTFNHGTFDRIDSDSEKLIKAQKSFHDLYKLLSQNIHKGISAEDPQILDKIAYVCSTL
jgi:hypothetical protein